MRSSISSSALHSAVLASLTLGAASGVSLGQAFNEAPAHPAPGATMVNYVSGAPSLGTDQFFRVSNINGVVGAANNGTDLETVALATTGGLANADNYLSRIGQFSFAYDNPILNVRLALGVDSVYTVDPSSALVSPVPVTTLDGSENRSAFLLHDFGLLFVGNGGARFAMTRITDPDPLVLRYSADENFALVDQPGTGFSIEFIDPPNLDGTGELIPLPNQLRSLEWLDAQADDLAWNPNPGYTIPDTLGGPDITIDAYNDTFPVTADAATPSTFYMERGIDLGADPLYVTGGNNTVWNVYLFSTGPVGSNLQLNLSQIQVTLAVPEASDALAAGMGLILVAGVIRSRMRA